MSLLGYEINHGNVIIDQIIGPASISKDILNERLLSFDYTEQRRKMPRAILRFDNSDGQIFNLALISIGLAIKLTIGYPKNRTRPLEFVIKTLKGALARTPATVSPASTSLGVIEVEGVSRHIFKLLHSPKTDSGTFYNMALSDIVKQIARMNGFKEHKIIVQDTEMGGVKETKIPYLVIPDNETYTDFLARMAEKKGFNYYVRNDEFHFHDDDWEIKPETIEYFRGPDLLGVSITGDYTMYTNRALIRSHNLATKDIVAYSKTLDPSGHARIKGGSVIKQRQIMTKEDLFSSISEEALSKLNRRLSRLVRNKWKLKLTLVGNPAIFRGVTLDLSNFGPVVDGEWGVHECKHIVDTSGYTTEVMLRRKFKRGGKGSYKDIVSYDTNLDVTGNARVYKGLTSAQLDKLKRKLTKTRDKKLKNKSKHSVPVNVSNKDIKRALTDSAYQRR